MDAGSRKKAGRAGGTQQLLPSYEGLASVKVGTGGQEQTVRDIS